MHQCQVSVVGAGIAGLAAAIALARDGHLVTVLESQTDISEIGAGIQIPPNASRILCSWGLRDDFEKRSTTSKGLHLKRYSDGELLGTLGRAHKVGIDEFPLTRNWTIWRPDYQQILHQTALKHGIAVQFRETVQNPHDLQADLVILADGIGSRTRKFLLRSQEPSPTVRGRAYRVLIPRDAMLGDSATTEMMTDGYQRLWLGPGRYVMSYPIAGGRFFNMVMARPGAAAPGVWNRRGGVEEMRKEFSDFEPVVQRLLGKVDSCIDWTIGRLPVLPRWTSDDGRMLLIGDAAHAMTPDYAQGAAMCVEDAAVLADCLRRADTISEATGAFEALRKGRTERIQKASWDNGTLFTLPDGDEQQERDRMYERRSGHKASPSDSGAVSDSRQAAFAAWVHGLDVLEEASQFWQTKNSPPSEER